jgi:hypothetical protein
MKKGKEKGEGVWLGIVSGLGTPDRGLKPTIPFKWEEYFLDRVWGFPPPQAQPHPVGTHTVCPFVRSLRSLSILLATLSTAFQ